MYKIANQLVVIDSSCHFTIWLKTTPEATVQESFSHPATPLCVPTCTFLKPSMTGTSYQQTLFITELWDDLRKILPGRQQMANVYFHRLSRVHERCRQTDR